MNDALVEQGYACAFYVSPAGTARREEFEDLQAVAKTSRTGLWGSCTMVTCEN